MNTYTTTEFAKKAHVSVRTIRYYDDIGLLKPSCYDAQGCRCYTEEDFFCLQKVLSLKYFGFSLKEIEELTREKTFEEVSSLFDMQIKLVRKKIENLKQVEKGLLQQFLKKEIGSGKFRITKDAGLFICKKVRKQYERRMSDL